MGLTFDSFHILGTFARVKDLLNKVARGADMASEHSLSNLLLIPSGPFALPVFRVFRIFFTSVWVVSILDNLWSVVKMMGGSCWLKGIGGSVCCRANYSVKYFDFSEEVLTTMLPTLRAGIPNTFLFP